MHLSKSTTKRGMSGKIATGRILVSRWEKTMRGPVHDKNDGMQGEGFRANEAVPRLSYLYDTDPLYDSKGGMIAPSTRE